MNNIEVVNLTKKFGDFVAINGINLEVKKGEIHAICGENGAGKSTLMNMLFGLIEPSSGQIFINGEEVHFQSPKEAIHQGIGMVHQHFKLVPSLTVYENILLGEEIVKGFKIQQRKEYEEVQKTIDHYNFDLNGKDKIQDISVGAQQRVEIIKMLHRNVDILILDEPSAVLTPQETDELLDNLIALRNSGKTIIIITHKLDEVKKCADRITVIRHGKFIGTVNNKDVNQQEIAKMMVGRDVKLDLQKEDSERGNVVLLAKNINAYSDSGSQVLYDVSMNVHEGEIVGIAGVEGNGQSFLMNALSGMLKLESGEIIYQDNSINDKSPQALRDMKIGLVPEDRYLHGLNSTMSIRDNLIAGYHWRKQFCDFGVLQQKEIAHHAKDLIERFDIRNCDNTSLEVGSLSGGNAQKIVIAREMSMNPNLLILSQPTRGVDIGSIEFIHQQIIEFRRKKKAVIVISSELSEVMTLSDRIYVMYKGRVIGERLTKQTSKEEIGVLMAGITDGEAKFGE
ncbi:ABC transporter ATP-binding protein [Peribacillus loiseleuriae]|uniref:ABC transporter ATP-binding protein n=1 Tax=Peribacillus loiseleuriae TaxID=1679170 RepID=A0A0K9GZ33_9BACI|nr:ABC transporter ATP-binding protein [Peribacillus loiseleuriae]KMY51502.1 ABC transporter ATP-binding protein [Peribacillus loiseleuriae]